MSILKLFNDDCLNILKDLDSDSVDLIITSPPYNLGHNLNNPTQEIVVSYNSYDDNQNQEDYNDWQVKVLDECYRVLKPTGLLYYNHKERHSKGEYFHPLQIIQQTKFHPLQTIIWRKNGGVMFNTGRFSNNHELILVCYKSRDYMRIDLESEKYFDVWDINRDRDKYLVVSFPLELPLRIINSYKDYTGLTVLDCFMGTGTTGLACKLSDNVESFIGVELDKDTFEYAKKKIGNYQSRLI